MMGRWCLSIGVFRLRNCWSDVVTSSIGLKGSGGGGVVHDKGYGANINFGTCWSVMAPFPHGRLNLTENGLS